MSQVLPSANERDLSMLRESARHPGGSEAFNWMLWVEYERFRPLLERLAEHLHSTEGL